jgi:protein subunit release factor A
MTSLTKKIEQIEKQLEKLKLMVDKNTPVKKSKKVADIEKCKSKYELKTFTVRELKDWIKENKIDARKLAEKRKDELVEFVWKHMKKLSEDSSSEESCSESELSDSDA